MGAFRATAVPDHGSPPMSCESRTASSPSTGTFFRTRRPKRNPLVVSRCSAIVSRGTHENLRGFLLLSGPQEKPESRYWKAPLAQFGGRAVCKSEPLEQEPSHKLSPNEH